MCSDPKCQRERHRRNCAEWHLRNPEYDREDRLRRRLVRAEEEGGGRARGDPFRRVDESAARDSVGLEVFVFIDIIGRHLAEWVRDLVGAQPIVAKEEISRHPPGEARDEIGHSGPIP